MLHTSVWTHRKDQVRIWFVSFPAQSVDLISSQYQSEQNRFSLSVEDWTTDREMRGETVCDWCSESYQHCHSVSCFNDLTAAALIWVQLILLWLITLDLLLWCRGHCSCFSQTVCTDVESVERTGGGHYCECLSFLCLPLRKQTQGGQTGALL